jgi:hypothetical protein
MRKLLSISLIAAVAFVGCGSSSSNHTSEWSKAKLASLESQISSTSPEASSDRRACYVKAVAAAFSPSDLEKSAANSADKQKIAKQLEKCGLKKPGITTSTSSSSGKMFGPACQKELQSAACVEEQSQKMGEAAQQGTDKVSEEQQSGSPSGESSAGSDGSEP